MRMVFRADASLSCGSGHVMRISVLAEEAIARGYECIFVGRIDGLEWVRIRIGSLGFAAIFDDEDIFQSNPASDILVLDSYDIPRESRFIDHRNWKMILILKDSKTPEYKSDIQLSPSLSKPAGNVPESFLSGPDYMLIRKGITKTNRVLDLSKKPKILVVGGGSDPFGFVKSVASALVISKIVNQVHFFSNEDLCLGKSKCFSVHPLGLQLDKIAAQVDLVLTTASTTSFEFIAREIPVAVACAVDNQKETYDQLGNLGLASQIGYLDFQNNWNFDLAEMKSLLSGGEKLWDLKNRIRGLIDLHGASRVLDQIQLFISGDKN
jgi:spore coat polysaccharide biosynthesis predicted glycosyltransferase SpsG